MLLHCICLPMEEAQYNTRPSLFMASIVAVGIRTSVTPSASTVRTCREGAVEQKLSFACFSKDLIVGSKEDPTELRCADAVGKRRKVIFPEACTMMVRTATSSWFEPAFFSTEFRMFEMRLLVEIEGGSSSVLLRLLPLAGSMFVV